MRKTYIVDKAATDHKHSHYRSTTDYLMQLYRMDGMQAARSIAKELMINHPHFT